MQCAAVRTVSELSNIPPHLNRLFLNGFIAPTSDRSSRNSPFRALSQLSLLSKLKSVSRTVRSEHKILWLLFSNFKK